MNNKKGSLFDVVLWTILTIVVIVVLATFVYMFGEINTALGSVGTVGGTNITEISESTFGRVDAAAGYSLHTIALIIIVMQGLSIMIHNYLIKENPLFFVVYVIITLGAIGGSAIISNSYETLLTNDILGTTLQGFTAVNFIMAWLPYWAAIIGLFGALFLFIKRVDGGDGV